MAIRFSAELMSVSLGSQEQSTDHGRPTLQELHEQEEPELQLPEQQLVQELDESGGLVRGSTPARTEGKLTSQPC